MPNKENAVIPESSPAEVPADPNGGDPKKQQSGSKRTWIVVLIVLLLVGSIVAIWILQKGAADDLAAVQARLDTAEATIAAIQEQSAADVTALRTALTDAEAALAETQAQNAADIAALQANLADAETVLTAAQEQNAADISALQAALADAEAALAEAQAQNAAAIAALRTALADAEAARIEAQEQNAADIAALRTALADAEAARAEAQEQNAADIAALQAALADAEATLAEVQAQNADLMNALQTESVSAAADSIVCSMEVAPSALSGPGDVTITITLTNTADTDMAAPLTLYDPAGQPVADFGDGGSVFLKAGEEMQWTGAWAVDQQMLDNGQIVYSFEYPLADGAGETQSRPIRGNIGQADEAHITVTRVIFPETASEGETVNVTYTIVNDGSVSVTNLALQESGDIRPQKLAVAAELQAGETAQVTLPVVMGTEKLTSKGTVSYTIAGEAQERFCALDALDIPCREPAVIAALSADSKEVPANKTVMLTLVLRNTGDHDYTNLRVTDATLGDVFTELTLLSGETLTLEKEITMTLSTTFRFDISAADTAGAEVGFTSNELTVETVSGAPAAKEPFNVTYTAYSPATLPVAFEAPEGWIAEETDGAAFTLSEPDAQTKDGQPGVIRIDAVPVGEDYSVSQLAQEIKQRLSAIGSSQSFTEWNPSLTATRRIMGSMGVYANYSGTLDTGVKVGGRLHATTIDHVLYCVQITYPLAYKDDFMEVFKQLRETIQYVGYE